MKTKIHFNENFSYKASFYTRYQFSLLPLLKLIIIKKTKQIHTVVFKLEWFVWEIDIYLSK